jgi:hypothetical protein
LHELTPSHYKLINYLRRFVRRFATVANCCRSVADPGSSTAGRVTALTGEMFDLIRNDGKSSASFAFSRGFNPGVQCQQKCSARCQCNPCEVIISSSESQQPVDGV